MKSALKSAAKRLLKASMRSRICQRAYGFLCMSRRSYQAGLVAPRLERELFHSRKVLHGPFRGMVMPDFSCWAKLLGSYEDELHELVEAAVQTGYQQVVNIGCSDGYYAVGLALRLPQARIIGYDLNADALARCRRNAQANGIEPRLQLLGGCSPEALRLLDFSLRTLVVCDVDGYETKLLDPEAVPGLLRCDFLIEVHDFFVPGTTDKLTARFGRTHEIIRVREQLKSPAQYPPLAPLSVYEQKIVLDEDRLSEDQPLDHEWFIMRVKGTPSL